VDRWRVGTGGLAATAAGALLLAGLPQYLAPYQTFQLSYVGAFAIALLGLNLLTGYSGQISLGHGAFLGVGGYTTAVLMHNFGVSYLVTIPIAGLLCGALGFLFGIPALRLSGLYLALATFALAVATPSVLKKPKGLTGGGQGIVLPPVTPPAGLDAFFSTEQWLYYLTWVIAALLFLFAWNLVRSRTGRAFKAVRDSEEAALAYGVSLAPYKTLAFGLSAFYAGVAGSLIAVLTGFVSPDSYSFPLSLTLLVGVVVGGLGSIAGAVYGAVVIEFLPLYAQNLNKAAPSVVYGVILILVAFLMPTGIAGFLRTTYSWARRQVIARAAAGGAAGLSGDAFVTDRDEHQTAKAKEVKP
jgi:branched-chain amino acid transport system permease protein